MLAMRKRRMRWLVYLFPTQHSVSEAPCSLLPSSPAPGHCREVAWGRVWAACMEMKLSYIRRPLFIQTGQRHQQPHSFIRGPTATGCPRRALPWIQLVADPTGTQLQELMGHCHAITDAHLLHHVPGSIPLCSSHQPQGLFSDGFLSRLTL